MSFLSSVSVAIAPANSEIFCDYCDVVSSLDEQLFNGICSSCDN